MGQNILRVVIASQRSRNKLEQLHINCHDIRMFTDQVVELIEEREQAKIAKRKRLDWTETQLAEIMDETDSLKERKQDLQGLLAPTTKSEKKRVKEMIRRTQLNLINENLERAVVDQLLLMN